MLQKLWNLFCQILALALFVLMVVLFMLQMAGPPLIHRARPTAEHLSVQYHCPTPGPQK